MFIKFIMSEKNVSLEITIKDFTATLVFSNSKSNALSSNLLGELIKAFKKLSQQKQVKVIILKSKGTRVFCAGASFDELLSIKNIAQSIYFFNGFADLINAMRRCSKIIVGNVQGKSVGGGIGLIAACDYVFATESSGIKLSEIAIGIGPFVIAPAVIRKMGRNAFTKLTLQPADFQTALWAAQNGLYTEIFSQEESLESQLQIFTDNFKTYNLTALEQLKKTLWEGTEHWREHLSQNAKITAQLALSEQTQKKIRAFKKT